jgi:transcriptional regulator with XRE-family HTH domain
MVGLCSMFFGGGSMELGARIRQLRERAGLSQPELAERACQSLRSIQNWEQGHRRPKIDAVLGIASALGLTVDELMREAPAGEPKRLRGRPPKKPATVQARVAAPKQSRGRKGE